MKKLAVAMKNGVAIVSDGKEVLSQVSAVDSTIASLEAIKEFLATVPVNSAEDLGEGVTIYLPKTIRGLASGAVANYIRENKTSRGNELQPETVALYKDVMLMFGERCLNVVFKDAQYAGSNNKDVAVLVNNVWAKMNTVSKNAGSTQAPAQQVVNPKIASKIKELEDQIVDAIMEDDDKLEAELSAKLAKLKALLGSTTVTTEPKAVETVVETTVETQEVELSADDQFDAEMNA